MSTSTKSWEETVPADLVSAISHLRESFDLAHFNFGWPTTQLCYWRLHGGTPKPGTRNIQQYIDTLEILKTHVGSEATRRFVKLLSKETPPAIFKAFYDLYMDGLKLQIGMIFSSLLQIGSANRTRISQNPIEWARSLSEELINYHRHQIPSWIRSVCDEQPWDPTEDIEEQIFWRKWQAPSFLIMEPARFGAYDPERAWNRHDQETSSRWLDAFTDNYVLILGIELKNMAGMAALRQAMTPISEKQLVEKEMSQTFNLHGPNARINIGSTDNSTNVVHQIEPLLKMREAIKAEISDDIEQAKLLKSLDELEQTKDRGSASERYQEFIAAAANHVTILGPYLPALGHWVHNLFAGT